MTDGISVGDAVLSFIGDTTQLDETFASLPAKANQALQPIQTELDGVSGGLKRVAVVADETLGEEIPAAAELTRRQMSEARGEVRLLGEEFGIRLPRHVANFVAEMPGVGAALSAAFSATAVLFLVKALVEATEKVSDFVGGWLIYTSAMKAADAAGAAHAQAMDKQGKAYDTAKKALDEYGKSQLEISSDKIDVLTKAIAAQNDIISDSINKLSTKVAHIHELTDVERLAAQAIQQEAVATKKALDEQLEAEKKIASGYADETAVKSLHAQIELQKELTNTKIKYKEVLGLDKDNADELRYQASLKALKALAAVEAEYNAKDVAAVKKANADVQAAEVEHFQKMQAAADKGGKDLEKTFAEMQKEVGKNTVGAVQVVTASLPPLVQGLLKMRQAAKQAGVTLRSDLVASLNAARIAKNDFVNTMGTKDAAAIHQFDNAIHKAQLNLKHFNEEAKKGKQLLLDDKSAMDEFKESSTEAAQAIGSGVSKAFDAMITHSESFGEAMKKATFSMLAAMAEKWGAYYIAKGMADIWSGNEAMAADELAGGLALEVLGGVMSGLGSSGGAGGNNSTTQSQSSSVDTGGSTRSTIGVTGVQKLAMGGLVSAPTLAVVGENPGETEAVLPLSNDKAMSRIGQSIANSGGGAGDTHFHVNVKGLVSPDNLSKVMKQINNRVAKGQGSLVASNSFRITKRSA